MWHRKGINHMIEETMNHVTRAIVIKVVIVVNAN